MVHIYSVSLFARVMLHVVYFVIFFVKHGLNFHRKYSHVSGYISFVVFRMASNSFVSSHCELWSVVNCETSHSKYFNLVSNVLVNVMSTEHRPMVRVASQWMDQKGLEWMHCARNYVSLDIPGMHVKQV